MKLSKKDSATHLRIDLPLLAESDENQARVMARNPTDDTTMPADAMSNSIPGNWVADKTAALAAAVMTPATMMEQGGSFLASDSLPLVKHARIPLRRIAQ